MRHRLTAPNKKAPSFLKRPIPISAPVVLVVSGLVWLVIGTWLIPPAIDAVYNGELLSSLFASDSSFREQPLAFYQDEWLGVTVAGFFAFLALAGLTQLLSSGDKSKRLVGDATPGTIGAIRMLVCGILLLNAAWESLPSTAALPRELIRPMGVLQLFNLLPGFDWFTSNATALAVFQVVTILALAVGFVGWRTRLVLPVAALFYLVFAGILRQYAWFYHTGLIPTYTLFVLSFLPSGDGWSIDRLIRLWNREPVPSADVATARYGWARYALWAVVALPYVAAGFSKLRNGGLFWWDAVNFKYILFYSTLRPMEFDFDVALLFTHAPDYVVEIMAIVALGGEVLYGLVLFFRWARWVLPVTMGVMHVGILLLQNILFFDLILLQVIFFNFRSVRDATGRWLERVRGRVVLVYDSDSSGQTRSVNLIRALDIFGRIDIQAGTNETLHAMWKGHRVENGRLVTLLARAFPASWLLVPLFYLPGIAGWTYDQWTGAPTFTKRTAHARDLSNDGSPRLVLTLTSILLFCWVFRLEFYPFTGMQMFSKIRGPVVVYEIPRAHLSSGKVIRAPIEQSIRAMRDSRFRRILQSAFDTESGDTAAPFMDTVARRWNARAPINEKITLLEIERWEWNYETDPDNSTHGNMVARRTYPVPNAFE